MLKDVLISIPSLDPLLRKMFRKFSETNWYYITWEGSHRGKKKRKHLLETHGVHQVIAKHIFGAYYYLSGKPGWISSLLPWVSLMQIFGDIH